MSAASSAQVKVTLPDGSQREYPQGTTLNEVAKSIGAGLARAALAAKVNGQMKDMAARLDGDSLVNFVTPKNEEGIDVIRHTTAHLMAMAVQKLYPGTQVTIGPVIENGFYYDFLFPAGVKINEADFPKIEAEMQAIVKNDFAVAREVVTRDEAIRTFTGIKELFKVEIIRDLPADVEISVYKMGGWFDLCVGPHVPSTGKLGAFKLTNVAGAYWRGDEKNAQLTRIYGTAWGDKAQLDAYLTRLEEAKKRDHRVLGKQLELFSFHKEAPAHPFFHRKGYALFNSLTRFMRRSNDHYGFSEVGTPLVMNVELWHKSGHYDNYRENMYFTQVDENEAAVKPMNCPGHCLIFASDRHSYRELPLRLSEFGRVHRHERSGVTHGLMRVRSFTQDDAHVFCMPEQIGEEVNRILEQIDKAYKGLGFNEYKVELSTRPAKSIGSDQVWNVAETALQNALEKRGQVYKLNPGDGAFYGPKIDFHLVDSIGRTWQCGTVQLDFSMPARFGLEYVGSDDKMHTPVMIHRAVLGSIERFLGIFIEHYAGHFPLWAAPVQARVVNVSEDQREYAEKVYAGLKAAGVRVEIDSRREKLGYKIREAQLLKTPYMLVVGDKEQQTGEVTARFHDGKNLPPMSIDKFVDRVKSECGDLWQI
jgi:threonyl-tRNA synthetase